MTLLQAVRATLRRLHYSPRTEEAYFHWIRAFFRYSRGRHPREMAAPGATAFLNHLEVQHCVSGSTRNQALCALVFLYQRCLEQTMPALEGLERARRSAVLPAVVSRREVQSLLDALATPFRLIAEVLHGSGLRLFQCLALRGKDVDLERHQPMVRRGKGSHDRIALLRVRVREDLRARLTDVARRHRMELDAGRGQADLLCALSPGMPRAATTLAWQYHFSASRPWLDRTTGDLVLRHVHEAAIQRAIHDAARSAGVDERAACHSLRHGFANHLLEARTAIRTIQTLLGHKYVRTTMTSTHIADRGPLGVVSPLDR